MSISVHCGCGKAYAVGDDKFGKRFRCRECSAILTAGELKRDRKSDLGEFKPLPPTPVDSTLLGGQNTLAGNPSLSQFSLLRYLRCRPRIAIVPIITLVLGIELAFLSWGFLVLTLVVAFQLGKIHAKMKRKLHGGDICPTVVLSVSPPLVATYTDMRASDRSPKHAIFIRRAPLRGMAGGPAKVGMRLAAVAWYGGSARQPAWKVFLPDVLNTCVATAAEATRVCDNIPDTDWRALQENLGKIPEKKPGLYKIWLMENRTEPR